MARFKNEYNIKEIKMNKSIHNLCTIGQDWYTNNIEIKMIPGDIIPDYIEVDRCIMNYEGKELIIEEVVSGILQKLVEYDPKYVRVTSKISDAMHLPVEVTTETGIKD